MPTANESKSAHATVAKGTMKNIIDKIRDELPKLTADIWACNGQPATREELNRIDSTQKIRILLDEIEDSLPKT